MHKQSTSTDIMAMNSIPVPITIIMIKFECLPPFEVLSGLAVGNLCGASTGDIATRGAVYHMQNNVNIHRTGLHSIDQSSNVILEPKKLFKCVNETYQGSQN